LALTEQPTKHRLEGITLVLAQIALAAVVGAR
jgi:hypothetical protein